MNISNAVDTIVGLRTQSSASDEHVAGYLKSSLESAGALAKVYTFRFSSVSGAFAMAVAMALAVVFVVSVVRRNRRAAVICGLAAPLLLFCELSLGWHIVSWPIQRRSENIVAEFPVQDAARRVIIGTRYTLPSSRAPGDVSKTVSAFLPSMSIVMAVLGLWQLAAYFGKLDFEDANTIAVIMGSVCAAYFGVALVVGWAGVMPSKQERDPSYNAGSIATLTALAENLAGRYPRLKNTSVSIVFLGGDSSGNGATSLAKKLARDRGRALPTYFIGCERSGGGGPLAYLIPEDGISGSLAADRELVRILNRAAVAATGSPLEIVIGVAPDSRVFSEYGFDSAILTTLPRVGNGMENMNAPPPEIDRGQLLVSLQLLEASLAEFEKPRSY